MQGFRSLICLLLLFAIPASSLQGYADFSIHSCNWLPEAHLADNLHLLTYDEILHLLDKIESGELEKRCSFTEWEKINQFLFTLANEGLLAQGVEVDTAEYEQIYALANDQSFVISHAVYYGDGAMFYSKTSWSSGWQNTKDFCKKHKKAIIIGVVVVVAVVAVVTIAVIASSSAAGAATAAAVASATANEPSIQNSPSLEKQQELPTLEVLPRPIEINQPSAIKEIIYEHLEPIKDLAQENVNSSSFREKAREFGSYLTHEALHSVSELTSVLPELQQELTDLSERFLPQGLVPEESKHAKDNFDTWIAQGHEKIDQMFSTNQAEYHTAEARAARNENITRCEMPLPRNCSSAFRTASAGGKHAGALKIALQQSEKELKKGIASFEKQISLHRDKIANPSKHIKNWHELDPRQQEALINKKWQSDIDRLTEQRDILHDVLKSKLSE
jgi:hypothetical protein